MKKQQEVTIIGGGLAGCEAAWQLLRQGTSVTLHEMKPHTFSPAHRSPHLAELVCSNSFRSNARENAVGLLKEEMRMMGSLIMEAAEATSVPAGKALAVDRALFSEYIEEKLFSCKGFGIIHGEVSEVPTDRTVIVATGPLTSDNLANSIGRLVRTEYLYFYDAISPIIEADSIDHTKVFSASRYETGGGDYLNCPFSKEEYEHFWRKIIDGREIPLKDFEDKKCFEGCLPIEVIARRGIDTLRFGPMKPVGLIDPATGERPYAVLQLRQENKDATLYNMVGFQTKLAWPEQGRIFRMVPGLEQATFARYGSIHRNTFINAPILLTKSLQLKSHDNIFFAGQITGVEGYVESTAMGLIAGLLAHRFMAGMKATPPPETTAQGALIRHIAGAERTTFQPMNVNFGLFPPLEHRVRKKERGKAYAARAIDDLTRWKGALDIATGF